MSLSEAEVKQVLLEEGLVTRAYLNRYEFKGYGKYFGGIATEEPVDLVKIAEDIQDNIIVGDTVAEDIQNNTIAGDI